MVCQMHLPTVVAGDVFDVFFLPWKCELVEVRQLIEGAGAATMAVRVVCDGVQTVLTADNTGGGDGAVDVNGDIEANVGPLDRYVAQSNNDVAAGGSCQCTVQSVSGTPDNWKIALVFRRSKET